MFASSNFKYIVKLNIFISIILLLPVNKANVLKENQIQSEESVTQHGTIEIIQTKEFVSLSDTDNTNDTTVRNPPQVTTRSISTIPTDFKNPVKNRRSVCNKKDIGNKNAKRRTMKQKPLVKPREEELLPQHQTPFPLNASAGLGNLNDLIRGVQIFNDPKVSQDISAFKTLLDAFEQMKNARSRYQEDAGRVDSEADQDEGHVSLQSVDKNDTRTPVKVESVPPSNYSSFSGSNAEAKSNKSFSMDYHDYVPPQYGDGNVTEDEEDYKPVESSAPNKRSIHRLTVRESGPVPPRVNTPKPPSARHLESYKPPVKPPTEPPAKATASAAVPPPPTHRTETSALMRMSKNSTSDHLNSLQDLWRDYQIAIVTVPAVFLVLLIIIIIYLIGKTGVGYHSVPSSSSYDSDTEIGTVRDEGGVSKNCPPQKEYLPYMEPPEGKGFAVSESERIIKTLGGYTLIRTKDSIADLLNYAAQRSLTPPSSAKSVATQVNNEPFIPRPNQSPITESHTLKDDDDNDVVGVIETEKDEGLSMMEAQERSTKKAYSPCGSDLASTESGPHNKKPKKRRRKPRKSPSFFKGCLSEPTDESADSDDTLHRLPSNDEAIQSVVTQGASLMKAETPVKGTDNEMNEVLRTDFKQINDMLTDGNWERAYYKRGGSVRFSDGPGSESPGGPGGPKSVRGKCKKKGDKKGPKKMTASEDGVFTMKYYLGSSAELTEKNPMLQRPF